jgi:hypothetical protein
VIGPSADDTLGRNINIVIPSALRAAAIFVSKPFDPTGTVRNPK